MDPIASINLLRIIGYAAIAPAVVFIAWTILHAIRYLPKNRNTAPDKAKEPKPQDPPKTKEPKKPKEPKRIKEPRKPKEPKQVKDPQQQNELPKTDNNPTIMPANPQPVKKTVHIRKPDAVKQVEEIWNQIPAAGAGWEGSPSCFDKEGGHTP